MVFDAFVKKRIELMTIVDTRDRPAKSSQCPTAMDTIYDYYFDVQQESWIAWNWIIPDYIHDGKQKFWDILVPTAYTLEANHVLSLMSQVWVTIFPYLSKQMLTFLNSSNRVCNRFYLWAKLDPQKRQLLIVI